MSTLVTLALVALAAVSLWLLWRAGLGAPSTTPPDRFRMLTTAIEGALALFVLRIQATWTPATAWLWVLGMGVLGGGIALAAWRARELPWVAAPTERRLKARRITAPPYAAALLAVTGLAYASLL